MKRRFLGFCAAAALSISFTACNETGDTSATKDTSGTTSPATETANTPVTSSESAGTYAAMADSVERNSQQGYYVNPKTGKKYSSLKVDRSTGRITDEAGEPVWRYVDNRNWWVYGGDNWGQTGEAKMQGEKLMYKGDADKWVDYDSKWKMEDEAMIKKYKISDGGMKEKIVTEDGDKIKIKTDEEGNTKIKVNDEKIKVDKDGNKKN